MNRVMSVRSKHKHTPPTDDPSNPPTAQNETCTAMEQTLLLPSQGLDVVHGSQEDKDVCGYEQEKKNKDQKLVKWQMLNMQKKI